jgi:hypothetical protein
VGYKNVADVSQVVFRFAKSDAGWQKRDANSDTRPTFAALSERGSPRNLATQHVQPEGLATIPRVNSGTAEPLASDVHQ